MFYDYHLVCDKEIYSQEMNPLAANTHQINESSVILNDKKNKLNCNWNSLIFYALISRLMVNAVLIRKKDADTRG